MPADLFRELFYAELPHLLEISLCLVAMFFVVSGGIVRMARR